MKLPQGDGDDAEDHQDRGGSGNPPELTAHGRLCWVRWLDAIPDRPGVLGVQRRLEARAGRARPECSFIVSGHASGMFQITWSDRRGTPRHHLDRPVASIDLTDRS